MTAVAVVVPVHDEEELLARCLASLTVAQEAAARAGARVEVVAVLDACTDRSAAIAAEFDVTLVEVSAARVGTARRAGVSAALRRLDPADLAQVWIANTDADSVVPANWLTHQLTLMRAGSDLMLGTVRPDFADLAPAHVAYWRATHHRGRPPGNTHGANLGVRGSVYRAAGGFTEVPEHEDVRLVEAARALGAIITPSDVAEVMTSGRFEGRTPGGYAAFVRATAAQFA
ncbi:glycosyltransferase involved in cell wall biosynthesis [Microbacterium sp. AK009]|uniref:glycosyltransferase n=1 Tax=Microbacterium sp. AK009 TaxID=2723068 RepID=UPI0015C9DB62|nr:glycosyltransferase [Microbacterium sp. AK009]NYF15653.1 glycosyltransferase involved in cell wall biosynthesis [Microbacterium sp. AK009]